jgi:hypothetical protein
MQRPDWVQEAGDYRYGFNEKEKDDEVYGAKCSAKNAYENAQERGLNIRYELMGDLPQGSIDKILKEKGY